MARLPWNRLQIVVVLTFALIGFVGGVGLFVAYGPAIPPVIYGLVFGVGVASLVYGFLGGISENTSFSAGAFKVGGSLAAILGVVVLLNGYLERQIDAGLIDHDDLVGRWVWQWAGENLHATLDFEKKDGELVFDGTMLRLRDGARHIVYDIKDGRAQLDAVGRTLTLSFEANEPGGRSFRLTTVQPLGRQLSFLGLLRPDPSDARTAGMRHYTWGFGMQKER